MKIDFKPFIDKHQNDVNSFGKKLIITKSEIKGHYSGWLVSSSLKETIEKNFKNINFGFNNSIVILNDGSIISNSPNSKGLIYTYEEVLNFSLKEKGFISKGEIIDSDSNVVGTVIGNDPKNGYEIFKEFKIFLNQQLKELKKDEPNKEEKVIVKKNKEGVNQNQSKSTPMKKKVELDKEIKIVKPKPTSSKPKKTTTKNSISSSKKVDVKQKSTKSKSKEGVNQNQSKSTPKKKKVEKPLMNEKLIKGNSIKYFEEKNVLFSIDFFDEFIIQNKKTKLVYESWLVKKDEIKIFKLDKESFTSYLFFLQPSKFFIEKKTNNHYNRFNKRLEPTSVGDTSFTFKDIFFKNIEFRLQNESYWSFLNINEWNDTNNDKFGKKFLEKFKTQKFSFSLQNKIKIDELKNLNFDINYEKNEISHFLISNEKLKNYLKPPSYKFLQIITGLEGFNTKFISSDNLNKEEEQYFVKSFTKLKVLIEKGFDTYKTYTESGLSSNQNDELSKFQKGNDSKILDFDLYFQILKNNQKRIIDIDRDYVQKFIKLNNYLKEKYSNLYLIHKQLVKSVNNREKERLFENEEEINFFEGIVYSYNLMVNHSIVMVTSLVEDDMITFYEIYEVFDKMNVFNTNWENEVNNKLSEINESLQDLNFSIRGLMNQMRGMERNIVNGLQSINTSIGSLENSVNKQLSETNSRLKYENLTNYYKKSTLPGVMDWFDGPK